MKCSVHDTKDLAQTAVERYGTIEIQRNKIMKKISKFRMYKKWFDKDVTLFIKQRGIQEPDVISITETRRHVTMWYWE